MYGVRSESVYSDYLHYYHTTEANYSLDSVDRLRNVLAAIIRYLIDELDALGP